jgi:hypothetical protein
MLTAHRPSLRQHDLAYCGGIDAVDGRPTLIGWFILAGLCLSPILTFWIGSMLGRFLRRKLQSRVLRGGAIVADRSGSTGKDKAVDQN